MTAGFFVATGAAYGRLRALECFIMMRFTALLPITVVTLGAAIVMQSQTPADAATYSATAYCGATGARGTARGSDARKALEKAIERCVANGGIPRCCRQGTHLRR